MYNIFALICVIGTLDCPGVMDYSLLMEFEPFKTKAECEAVARKESFPVDGSSVRLVCDDRDIFTIQKSLSNEQLI